MTLAPKPATPDSSHSGHPDGVGLLGQNNPDVLTQSEPLVSLCKVVSALKPQRPQSQPRRWMLQAVAFLRIPFSLVPQMAGGPH